MVYLRLIAISRMSSITMTEKVGTGDAATKLKRYR